MGLSHLSAEELAAWVEASCASQGVPVKVTDPMVVRRVGTLLGASGAGVRGRKRSGTRTPAPEVPSVSPGDLHAGGVEEVDTGGAGSDGGLVDQGGDDGVLPGQVEVRPGAA